MLRYAAANSIEHGLLVILKRVMMKLDAEA